MKQSCNIIDYKTTMITVKHYSTNINQRICTTYVFENYNDVTLLCEINVLFREIIILTFHITETQVIATRRSAADMRLLVSTRYVTSLQLRRHERIYHLVKNNGRGNRAIQREAAINCSLRNILSK